MQAPSHPTILVVDDNIVNRKILAGPLRAKGFEVLEAEDGRQALRMVESETVDLVVLDILMPILSGIEVLTKLRQSFSSQDLPIIMATAVDQDEDMVKAFELGANDYITKPFKPKIALARIAAHLRTRGEAYQSGPRRMRSVVALRELEPGTVLEGKYRLDALLGAGHHGVVYRGTHLPLSRPVAIKILQVSMQSDETMLARFRQEGVSGGLLQHGGAVSVLDFGTTEDGIAFLVMELLDGFSLDDELQRSGRLTPRRVGEVMIQVCDVMAEAHALGIIHRDIKPENIFLHQTPRREMVKVLDFGVAKLIDDAAQHERLTLDGIAGTPAYLAPERLLGDDYDGRADVYSLGVMLYELLSGQMPFETSHGNPVRMVMMHVNEIPRPLRQAAPEVPAELAEVVEAALAKDPAQRPTAAELARRLADATGVELPEHLRLRVRVRDNDSDSDNGIARAAC